jgi:predicted permease
MLVAIAAGFTCALLGWHLPPMLQKPLSMLGAAAGPVALFVVGGSLVGLTLDGLRTALAVVTTSKLVLHPLAVAGVLWAWSALVGAAGLPAGWALDGPLSFAVVAFAAMPMLGIYPVLALKYGEVRFASAVLLVTTLASFVTLTAWLWALGLTTMN